MVVLPQFLFLKYDNATDRFSFMHEIESGIDVFQRHGVGDHGIDLDLAVHVPVDDLWYVGAATGAAEGRAPPGPSGYKLLGAV
jgi:hypothetical protein